MPAGPELTRRGQQIVLALLEHPTQEMRPRVRNFEIDAVALATEAGDPEHAWILT